MLHIINGKYVSEIEFKKWYNYLDYHEITFEIEMERNEFIKISFKESLYIFDEDLVYLEDDSIECRYEKELKERSKDALLKRILKDINKLDNERVKTLKEYLDI